MAGRSKVGKISYIGQEPSFIRKFKERVGYKEEVTVEAKREAATKYREDRADGSDHSDREDERPQVVVMAPGDLTKSEADRLGAFSKPEEETETPADGKILFKKPTKRASDADSELNASTKKKKSDENTETVDSAETKESHKGKKTKVKQKKSLLSFDDEEEDDV